MSHGRGESQCDASTNQFAERSDKNLSKREELRLAEIELMRQLVTGQEKIQEIPRRQRLIGRPGLKDLFEGDGQLRTKRDRMILKVVHEYGYSQVEVARHLRLHYSTLSRIVKRVSGEQE
jgi:REP-associated tyrosine transposase